MLDSRDGFHEQARTFQAVLGRGGHGHPLTTDYVLDEAVTYLHLRSGTSPVRSFREILRSSESVQGVWTTPDRFWSAWEMLTKHEEKRWSLTDRFSFLTLSSLGIRKAFGLDADFRQAGFELLPAAR